MKNNVLISGSTGFVGKNFTAYSKNLPGFTLYPLKLRDVKEVLIDANITHVLHLAGKAHDTKNTSAAAEYFEVNTELTKKLFDAFLQCKAATFIFMSSVKAVADTVDGVLIEDVIGTPQTPYGQSKFEAEQYLLSKELPAGKKLFILRPCMIHGPGNKGNLNLLYRFVVKGIPYPFAAFENHRSFLSVSNLNYVIEKLVSDAAIAGGVYNVADDEPLSTNQVITLIANTSNLKPKLWRLNRNLITLFARVGDKLRLPVNTERLKKLTENYVVSNDKLKNALHIQRLPTSSAGGLTTTIKSFLVQ